MAQKFENVNGKKAIYAKHGIEYNAGKILYNGKWIAELLKAGNSKTGKRVYTWSTLPGKKVLAFVIATAVMHKLVFIECQALLNRLN